MFDKPTFESKIISPDQIAKHISALAQPIVFTNGVFDIVHRGHVTYLAQARAEGASLIVALNDDASTKRLGKGTDRPINTLEDRLSVIAALECVSLVTHFSEDTPSALIQIITPQVLVKGGDWSFDDIVGGDWTRQHGGRVLSIPFKHKRSTTQLINRIRQA
ncbi:MAG: adenylyltransferase/cytidyltransferase family protein [Burkholderiaceae bacterium]